MFIAGTGWKPSDSDWHRFSDLKERRARGETLSAEDSAFVGQFAAQTLDAIDFESVPLRRALQAHIGSGALGFDQKPTLADIATPVPDLPDNPELQKHLNDMLRQGGVTDADVERMITLVGKLSFHERDAVTVALGALIETSCLTPTQKTRVAEWLQAADAQLVNYRDRTTTLGKVGSFGIMAATIGVGIGIATQLPLQELGDTGASTARAGIMLGLIFGVRGIMRSFNDWIAKTISRYGSRD